MANNLKRKLYIGCALTKLPPDQKDNFLKMITQIRKELGENFEVMEFLGITGPSTAMPKMVYDHDIKNSVMKADYLLAICDHASLGLGYEIATAVEKMGIPVLAVARKDSIVSNLIRGIDHKNFQFHYYDSVDDITKKTLEILTK